jgi:hypothetical protein
VGRATEPCAGTLRANVLAILREPTGLRPFEAADALDTTSRAISGAVQALRQEYGLNIALVGERYVLKEGPAPAPPAPRPGTMRRRVLDALRLGPLNLKRDASRFGIRPRQLRTMLAQLRLLDLNVELIGRGTYALADGRYSARAEWNAQPGALRRRLLELLRAGAPLDLHDFAKRSGTSLTRLDAAMGALRRIYPVDRVGRMTFKLSEAPLSVADVRARLERGPVKVREAARELRVSPERVEDLLRFIAEEEPRLRRVGRTTYALIESQSSRRAA